MLTICTNLKELDISHNTDVDPKEIVMYVKNCQQLEVFKLYSCKQFSEQQLTSMLCSLKRLEYVDATNTAPVRFCNCLSIVCSLKNLRCISLEPRFAMSEKKDWTRLVRNYPIVFGHAIKAVVPFSGR